MTAHEHDPRDIDAACHLIGALAGAAIFTLWSTTNGRIRVQAGIALDMLAARKKATETAED
jgi:hypothetical protein